MIINAQPRSFISSYANFVQLGVRSSMRIMKTVALVSPRAVRWLLGRRLPEPHEVRELFEAMGVTYIKFGQFIASSPSMFPKAYVDEFQSCLDRTPTLPFHKIKQIVEKELGQPVSEVFKSIDESPLASASIAQVHSAVLLNGDSVVIKVQKPGVENTLNTDFNAVYLMTRVMEIITPKVDKEAVAGVVAEVYQSMIDECDFIKEANNLQHFAEFLSENENQNVVVPKPYFEHTSKRVLTMERLYGLPLTDTQALEKFSGDGVEALFHALNTWFSSLMACDFFHADLHSGNIMLLDNGKVGFIDFGMVGRIQAEIWAALFDFFHAISAKDFKQLAKAMVGVGLTRESLDVDELAEGIEKVYNAYFSPNADDLLAAVNDPIAQFVTDLAQLAGDSGIRFPRAFTMLLKQFLYFDSYIQKIDPGSNLFDDDRVKIGMGF